MVMSMRGWENEGARGDGTMLVWMLDGTMESEGTYL